MELVRASGFWRQKVQSIVCHESKLCRPGNEFQVRVCIQCVRIMQERKIEVFGPDVEQGDGPRFSTRMTYSTIFDTIKSPFLVSADASIAICYEH